MIYKQVTAITQHISQSSCITPTLILHTPLTCVIIIFRDNKSKKHFSSMKNTLFCLCMETTICNKCTKIPKCKINNKRQTYTLFSLAKAFIIGYKWTRNINIISPCSVTTKNNTFTIFLVPFSICRPTTIC